MLVTGACGSLGASLTSLLASRGTEVYATDLRPPPAGSDAAAAIVPLDMDVASGDSVARASESLQAQGIQLDAVVCAAGLYVGGPLVEVSAEEMLRALEVNAVGPMRVVGAFFPMLRRPGGRIVLVSSESTRSIMPFTGPYAASKRALEAYADALRREVSLLGVHVVVIQPGAFRSPFHEAAARSLDRGSRTPAWRGALARGRRILEHDVQAGMDPSAVARVIARALVCRRPRRRYRVGNDRGRALLSRLPVSWADAIVKVVLARTRTAEPRRGPAPPEK